MAELNDPASIQRLGRSAVYLSLPWLIAFCAAFSVVAALAGALAKEFDGSLGLVIWWVGWCLVFAGSWFVTYKYANPMLPILFGSVVGLSIPRPSDEWFRQLAGESLGNAIVFLIGMVGCGIVMTVLTVIGKRHKSSSAA